MYIMTCAIVIVMNMAGCYGYCPDFVAKVGVP